MLARFLARTFQLYTRGRVVDRSSTDRGKSSLGREGRGTASGVSERPAPIRAASSLWREQISGVPGEESPERGGAAGGRIFPGSVEDPNHAGTRSVDVILSRGFQAAQYRRKRDGERTEDFRSTPRRRLRVPEIAGSYRRAFAGAALRGGVAYTYDVANDQCAGEPCGFAGTARDTAART